MTRRMIFAWLVLLGAAAITGWSQTTHQVEIKKGMVVYVSGRDLVVKMEDGAVKHFVVSDDAIFHIDGKDLHVQDLIPGMELTQTITTTTTDRVITNTRKIDATVWQVNAPYMIVTMADGTNKQVRVPDGTKFKIDGEDRTVFDLRPGMKLTGTIVTETPETEVSSSSRVTGTAPEIVGVLLIEETKRP